MLKRRFTKGGLPALVLIALVMASWFVQMTFPIESFDFFYHLATGRWIVEHRSIPTHEVFSSTAKGTRWITHEWAVQVILYWLYRLVGIDGLLVIKSLWLTLTAGLLMLLGRRLKSPPGWTALLTALAAPCLAFRAFLRPHVVSWGFMAILLVMLYSGLPAARNRRMAAIAGLFLIWANCHSGFVFGLFVLGIFQASDFIRHLRKPTEGSHLHRFSGSFLPLGTAVVAALINPNTWHAFIYPYLFMSHPELFRLVSELRPLSTPVFQGGWFIAIVYGLFTAAALLYLLRLRQGSLRELILLAVFGFLGINSVRNVSDAVLVILPGIMLHSGNWTGTLQPRIKALWRRIGASGGWLVAAGVAVFLFWTALGAGIPIDGMNRRHFGLGRKDSNYPTGAVEYIKKNDIKGNYYNTFAFGGYLLWELYPNPNNFIHGELFVFIGKIMDAYLGVLDGTVSLDRLRSDFGVNSLLISYPGVTDSASKGLYAVLPVDRSWVPVYWDDSVMLFIHEDVENELLTIRDGYRLVHPLERTLTRIDAIVGQNPEGVRTEALRAHADYPRNTGGAVYLGRYHALRGEHAKAIAYYDMVLDRHPDNHVIRNQKALGLMEINRLVEADAEWERLLREKPEDMLAVVSRGICLHRMGRRLEAMILYRRAENAGYRSAELMNGIGIFFAEEKNYSKAIESWERGLQIDPEHVQIRNNLERARTMKGKGQ